MIKYVSMASSFAEVVDCRTLQLELEFFQVPQKQLNTLAEICFYHTLDILKESFVVLWDWKYRRISQGNLPKKFKHNVGPALFSCEADVISDIVFDFETFYNYEQRLLHSKLLSNAPSFISTDFLKIFNDYIRKDMNPLDCKDSLLKIFYQRGKKKLSQWHTHDVMTYFTSAAHSNNKNLFHGEFNFRIAFRCLDFGADTFAHKLENIVLEISRQITNVSGRIALSPFMLPSSCSSHMRYFSGTGLEDGSHNAVGFNKNEWYPYYYLRGAEWFNLLSPLQQYHIPYVLDEARLFSEIIAQKKSNGSLILKLCKSIDKIDVNDLVPVKKLLNNSLFPGQTQILLKYVYDPNHTGYISKPRKEWELFPILDEEVIVYDDRVVFQHRNNTGDGLREP